MLSFDVDGAEGEIEAEIVDALERAGDEEGCAEPDAERATGEEPRDA